MADPMLNAVVRDSMYEVWSQAQDKAYEKAWMSIRMLACPKCYSQNRGLRGPKHATCRSYYIAAQTVWDEWNAAKQQTALERVSGR